LVSIRKLLASVLMPFLVVVSLALPSVASAAKQVAAKSTAKSVIKKKAHVARNAKAPVRTVQRVVLKNGKRVVVRHSVLRVRYEPAKPSVGQLSGLHNIADSLDLKSSVALILDQDTDEVLFSKNAQVVLPIASLTKLMTAVVVAEAGLPMDEVLSVTQADVDTEKGSRSRLKVGTQLSREEALHLALMSSENRAAHALGRQYPGGVDAFVKAMNLKAVALGMGATRFVEPTGLSSENRSSAKDLATLVKAAHGHPVIREMSTSPSYQIDVGSRHVQFVNTNRLLRNPDWDIGLQKTGYITEAGRCMVMQTRITGHRARRGSQAHVLSRHVQAGGSRSSSSVAVAERL
jgi:D-alanyl-D-alanine endopeptidase (penicillin-binding protein 7)